MTKKEYKVIYDAISHAQNAIEYLSAPTYPYGRFETPELSDMFYDLNKMCLKLINRMEETA